MCLRAVAYGTEDTLPTKEETGEVIRFTKFPTLPVFIFKTELGSWRVHDPKSGANLGCGGKTRKEAILDSWLTWNRLLIKRETVEALTAELEKLRKGWNDGKELNPNWEAPPVTRTNWEADIIAEIAHVLNCSNSDAQGVFEAQSFTVAQQWALNASPKDAAAAIVKAASRP